MLDNKHEHFNLEVRFCRNQGSNDIINRIKNNHTSITIGHSLNNKKIGGSVLTNGSVQEEIRYLICPECLIVILLCNNMEITPTESVSINGAERFSLYTGYGRSGSNKFQINEPFIDKTLLSGDNNILDTQIIAFDAQKFESHNINNQYDVKYINRDIIKLSSVFSTVKKNSKKAFVTGHWGCGNFKGNKMLKFCIQYLVAAHYGINLIYATREDDKFKKRFINAFLNKRYTVSGLYDYIKKMQGS